MEKVNFSDAERLVLKAVADKKDVLSIGLSENIIAQTAKSLKYKGFVRAAVNYDELIDIAIEPKGLAYLELYPELDSPNDVVIEKLQIENLRLQNNELKYKKRIRTWQAITAVFGLGNAIWALFSFLES